MNKLIKLDKYNFGIDAPIIFFANALAGILFGLIAYLLLCFHPLNYNIYVVIWCGFSAMINGIVCCYMLFSSKCGKFILANRMLTNLTIRPNTVLLDIGCGSGLLLVIAAIIANRYDAIPATGKFIGIDIWCKKDLSNSNEDAAVKNINTHRQCQIQKMDMRHLDFPDQYFDRVVANFSIHNLPNDNDRRQALSEMVRVLKPQGKIAIQDFRYLNEYAQCFADLNLTDITITKLSYLSFPWSRVVFATKAP